MRYPFFKPPTPHHVWVERSSRDKSFHIDESETNLMQRSGWPRISEHSRERGSISGALAEGVAFTRARKDEQQTDDDQCELLSN